MQRRRHLRGGWDLFTNNPNVGLIYQLQNGVWVPDGPGADGFQREDSTAWCPDDGDRTAVGQWLDQSYNWHALVLTLGSGIWSW